MRKVAAQRARRAQDFIGVTGRWMKIVRRCDDERAIKVGVAFDFQLIGL
jgi:hypothetical protein